MSLYIKDVVTTSKKSEFRNDVQLPHFRSSQNLNLVEGYIFTRKAVAPKKSSIELLKLLCEAYLPGKQPNRFVFMATYGHGKSHFALALANFFGKPAGSAETGAVLSRIEHAVNDAAYYGFFESFKSHKKPYLILLLSGIDQRDLQTQFFNAVEVALGDGEGKDIELPFWYRGAEQFLQRVKQNLEVEANNFLAPKGLELDLLIERVRSQDSSAYQLCYNLGVEIFGAPPNFGAALNLKDAVSWLSENLCGEPNPYGGLLILFDEFSAFIRDYCLTMESRVGTPLQDLLDGVDNCREKVAFVAFSQHDPQTVARNAMKGRGEENLQSLEIQINRLPKPERYYLHSCLEEVLDAYLKQDKEGWKRLALDPNFGNQIYEANDVAIEVFKKRYIDELGWKQEDFQEVVTKGCFPLHPVTTALLSSVEFQETTNPRSVLGFVVKAVQDLSNAPVITGRKISWILPIDLVDFFREMFGPEIWRDYIDALAQAGGPDAANDEVSVLKGMVLQKAANVGTRGFGFDKVIGQFAGFNQEDASGALQRLVSRSVIRYDADQRLYMFWPAGRGASKAEEILTKKVAGIRNVNIEVLERVDSVLRGISALAPHQVSIGWGHREDWQADEMLASKDILTEENLRKVVSMKLQARLDGSERCRCLIIWLVAEGAETIDWIRNNVASLINLTFGPSPIPIIIMRPKNQHQALINQLKRAYALEKFSNSEIQDAGRQQYEAVITQNNINIKESVVALRRDCEAEVPSAFRGRITARQPQTIDQLLSEIYAMAFAKGPTRWFTQYKVSSTALKTAAKLLISNLYVNSLDAPNALKTSNPAQDAVAQYLRTEWGIVGHDLRIKSPQVGAKAYPAWKALDEYFDEKAGARSVKKIVEELLNPPYGYDVHTVTILFSAWLGYNRHDLEIAHNRALISIDRMAADVKDLTKQLAEITIKRRNPDELKNKVNSIIKTLESGSFEIEEAEKAMKVLNDYVGIPNAEGKENIQKAMDTLQSFLDKAKNYDLAVNAMYSAINKSTNIKDLFTALSKIRHLSFSYRVKPVNDSVDSVKQDIVNKIHKALNESCKKYENLQSMQEFNLNYNNLLALRKLLEQSELTHLYKIVDDAIVTLNNKKEIIENNEKDKETIAIVRALPDRGRIIDLRNIVKDLENKVTFTEEAKKILNNKIKTISAEIDRILQLALSISERVEKVTTLEQTRSIKADLHRVEGLFEGSEQEKVISTVLDACIEKERVLEASEQARINAQEHDKQLLNALEVVRPAKQNLQELLHQLDAVSSMEFLTPKGEGAKDKKVGEIEAEISTLRNFISNIIPTIDKVKTRSQLQQVKHNLSSYGTRFEDSEHYATIENAVALCAAIEKRFEEEENAERLKQEMDLAILSELRGMNVSDAVAILRKNLLRLRELTPSGVIKDKVTEKAELLTAEIHKIQKAIEGAGANFDAIKDISSLSNFLNNILRVIGRLEGAEEHEVLKVYVERCSEVEHFLLGVNAVTHDAPSSPAEMADRIAKLENLADMYSENLPKSLYNLVSSHITSYKNIENAKEKEAIRWLDNLEKDLEQGVNPGKIISALAKLPIFLPREYYDRVRDLNAKAQEVLDRDQVLQVETLFQAILDNNVRLECLRRLQAIVNGIGQQ